ncbi:SNF2-related protein [Apilactobacillus waqarii]|uniref:SNF2-related protein n=1 Tax=Apilactobacillus waqarii TaxID=2851006 RepID=UPI003364E7DB
MLSDKNFKIIYSTDVDNIQNDFYVTALKEAKEYKRVSGYFSSASLSLFAEGLYELYKNGGKYYLLISNVISENDFKLIKKGYLDKGRLINDIKDKLSDFSELSDQQKDNFQNLAYLIEIGLVEIKIGFTKNGIFHAKYGIIKDDYDYLFFSGSLNETEAAFLNNYESITVNKGWTSEEDRKSIINSEIRFNKLWNNIMDDDMITVKEINEILRDELITYSNGKISKVENSLDMSKDVVILNYDGCLSIDNKYDYMPFNYGDSDIRLIRDVYLSSEKTWTFNNNLSIEEVSSICNKLSDYSKNNDINLKFSDSLEEYLKNYHNFSANELIETGILIKNQDKSLLEEYDKFNNVLSNEMTRKLREKQMWASFYMAKMKRVGNFSVPGSGKTSMVYGSFAYLRAIEGIDKIVVISPKNAFKAWKDEYFANFGDDSKLSVYNVQTTNNKEIMSSKEYNLYLFNYESVPKYEKMIKEKIIDDKTLLIFDEGHRIKSIDSQRSSACLRISKLSKYCFVLTGTPIPNNYSDIWNFMHILYNDEYNKVFGLDLGKLSKTKNGEQYSKEINEKLYPFYWRTNKKQLKVPDANDDVLYKCDVSEEEQCIASYLWKKYRKNPIILFIRLSQLSSNPELLYEKISNQEDLLEEVRNTFGDLYNNEIIKDDKMDESEINTLPKIKNSTKYKKAISEADKLITNNKKVIIWCLYKNTMHKVCSSLNKLGHSAKEISGSTIMDERDRIIEEFKHSDLDVIVSNPQTLAESVSLHDVCHDAMYLEYSFNLTHMLQSRDRIHRLGLRDDEETNYYYFLSKSESGKNGYIDEKIYKRLKEKENLMKIAVDGTSLSIDFDYNTKEEIRKIINE